ncbi:MAG: DUF481 domain-containing protein [Spongiibacteraceae bacterium]|jgi:putative salt-induced outer membrane protein YdiY|nr:DUF481 domain-containing protein [Spongiibacteraceae bacterium]
MQKLLPVLPVTLLLALPLTASAQDVVGLWSTDIEFGYVSVSGNSESSSVKGRLDSKRESDNWRYHIHFDALNTSEDDTRSAERYFLSNKIDYKFGERSYSFLHASYEDDRFSGYDWQAVIAAGYGYRLIDRADMTWDIEGGPGYRVSKIADSSQDDDEREGILRLQTDFEWHLTDNATFEQVLSVEHGSENTVSRSTTSIKTTIIARLAMKLSYTVKYTDNVPTGTEHADRETAVTLVYSF